MKLFTCIHRLLWAHLAQCLMVVALSSSPHQAVLTIVADGRVCINILLLQVHRLLGLTLLGLMTFRRNMLGLVLLDLHLS